MNPKSIFALAVFAWLLWSGYTRRRAVWTRRSWIALGASYACALGLIAVGMTMAYAVDLGIYRVFSSSAFATAWLFSMFGLLFAGLIAFLWLTWWFANGKPERHPRFFMPKDGRDGAGDAPSAT